MPPGPPAQAGPAMEGRTADPVDLPADHADRTPVHHRTHAVPHLSLQVPPGHRRKLRIAWSGSGGAEIGQHGQHPAMIVGAVREVELSEDAVHVLFYRGLGNPDL